MARAPASIQCSMAAKAIMALPDMLERAMRRHDLSLRGVARDTGLSLRVVARTANGDLPTAQHAAVLLAWLSKKL